MSRNLFSRNSNEIYRTAYTPGGYDKAKLRKILIVVTVCVLISVGVVLTALLLPQSEQSKYTKSATEAVRKNNPNAEASDVKVAGGFAIAIVKDPTDQGQSKAGSVTVFRVNKDDSMVQLATGSSFNPIDLLGLGIPLATQAKLTARNTDQVKQDLVNTCGYNGDGLPSYRGFIGSFDPNGWQIDATTLDVLQQSLAAKIASGNVKAKPGKNIICVNAIHTGSSATTDSKTYASTFTLRAQFITSDGTLTDHSITFTIGPRYYRSYMLDGQKLST